MDMGGNEGLTASLNAVVRVGLIEQDRLIGGGSFQERGVESVSE